MGKFQSLISASSLQLSPALSCSGLLNHIYYSDNILQWILKREMGLLSSCGEFTAKNSATQRATSQHQSRSRDQDGRCHQPLSGRLTNTSQLSTTSTTLQYSPLGGNFNLMVKKRTAPEFGDTGISPSSDSWGSSGGGRRQPHSQVQILLSSQ